MREKEKEKSQIRFFPPCQNPLPRILKCTSAKNTSWRYWGTPAGTIQISDQGDGVAYRRAGGGSGDVGMEKTVGEKQQRLRFWQRRSAVIINSCQRALKRSPDRSAVPNAARFLAACFLRLFALRAPRRCMCTHACACV